MTSDTAHDNLGADREDLHALPILRRAGAEDREAGSGIRGSMVPDLRGLRACEADSVYALLYAPRRIDQQIGRINAKIRSLRDSLMLSGVRYDRDTVQSSPSDRMSAVIAEIDALERKRDALISSRMQAMEEIEEAIDRLEDDGEKTVLYMQYIGRERMDNIADELSYSRRGMYKIRAKGLEHLGKHIS